MRALGKQHDRMQELFDLALRVRVTENRKPEGRLGDENIARNGLERRAGRIGHVLVVAGRDDAHPFSLYLDLRRAQHVAGRMKTHVDAVEVSFLRKRSLVSRRQSCRHSASA